MALPLLLALQLFTPLKLSDILEVPHRLARWKGDAVPGEHWAGVPAAAGGAPAFPKCSQVSQCFVDQLAGLRPEVSDGSPLCLCVWQKPSRGLTAINY